VLREPLPSGLAIPFLEGISGYLALDKQLRELAPLRLALERHHVLRSMGQASLVAAIISPAQ